jgi:FlaA1/EpsC-like NDP-sugar epimerase/lipopolysaccharide/colanic/teichoic acid biosynthesis glycosyltransferase
MAKRLFDIVASLLGLLILSPFLVLVAIAIKATSRGPVLFRQVRVGRNGREFRVLKFRTMVVDAPRLGGQLTVAGDPRITAVGRVLRASKMDEFPQLWNVVVGDMSLVGPRPEVPKYVALYDQEQRQVLSVRPGVTDYASITYFDENALLAKSADPEGTYIREIMPHKLRLNHLYLQRRSFVEDIRILLATVYIAVVHAAGRTGRVLQVVSDALVVVIAFTGAYALRFDFPLPDISRKQLILLLPYTVLARLAMNLVFGVYRVMWRYVSLYEVGRFAKAVASVTVVFLAFRLLPTENPYYHIPISIILMEAVLSFLGMMGIRFLRRWLHEATTAAPVSATASEKALVVGAGDNGRAIAHEIRLRPALGLSLVGFVDDDREKLGSEIEGRKVLGTLDDLGDVHARTAFSKVLLSISDLPLQRKREVMELCAQRGVRVLVLPGASQLISGQAQVAAVRDVAIEDLLGREVQELAEDDPLLGPVYGGKRVLVTGAGGSIGSELCRQISALDPALLILLDKDENNLFHIRGEMAWLRPDLQTVAVVLDVRARDKLERAFALHRPEVVLHAAAYKHVPLMEENPFEAVENNVAGTRNVAELAQIHGAQTFVMLSTDKAVNPTSVMGATKRVAELIVRGLAARGGGTRFASVRFGNVLGSRGSVIPVFRDQIARGGPVTVTHPEVVRYFMTIPEASQLVLKAGTIGREGEVFVLDMGLPIRIVDLARDMIRLSGFREGEIPIAFTGLRPGEKLFEELLLDRDRVLPTQVDKVFVSRPELRDFDAWMRQVDDLVDRARGADRAGIRALMDAMDIGLRPPDVGGADGDRGRDGA